MWALSAPTISGWTAGPTSIRITRRIEIIINAAVRYNHSFVYCIFVTKSGEIRLVKNQRMENYIVSARKYRSSTFKSVVGQRGLTTTLKHAIEQNKLAHAYLFCGSRGVMKTLEEPPHHALFILATTEKHKVLFLSSIKNIDIIVKYIYVCI